MKFLDFIERQGQIWQCLDSIPRVLKHLITDYVPYELVPRETIDPSVSYDDFYIEPDEIIGYVKPDVYTQEPKRGGWHVLCNGNPTNIVLLSPSTRVYRINNDAVLMHNALTSCVWYKDGREPKYLPSSVEPVVHDGKVFFVTTFNILSYYDPISRETHLLDTNIEKITLMGNQLRMHRYQNDCEEPKYGYRNDLYLLLPHGIYTMDLSRYVLFPSDMEKCYAFGEWLFVICENNARMIIDLKRNCSIVFYDDKDYIVDGSNVYSIRDSTIYVYE